jgi:ribonuclease HII
MPRWTLICGVDEAGRGPLAGPVYAAAVIINPRAPIAGVADSKTLPAPERERLAVLIRERAHAWAVGIASVEEIDRFNILRASLLAMSRAVQGLRVAPQLALVDGVHCPPLFCRTRAVVQGDSKIPSISAASILAKTERDAEMARLHRQFPNYGLDRHKGYATAQHLEALQRFGVCDIHRRSFAPVRDVIAGRAPACRLLPDDAAQ